MTLFFVLIFVFKCSAADDAARKLNETWTRIRELDNNLTDIYRSVPRGLGETFLNNLRLFNEELKKIIEFATEDSKRTFQGIRDVLEKHPGPGWTDVDFNETVLKEHFGWDDKGIKKMYDIRRDTFIYWNNIWCRQANYPPPEENKHETNSFENLDD